MSPHLNLNSPLIRIPDYQSSWVLRTNSRRITSTDRQGCELWNVGKPVGQRFRIRKKNTCVQGGRSWQPFVGGKNGQTNFRQTRIYHFRDKCVVFARNCKFANLTQYNMQYIPVIVHFLSKEHCF